MYYQFYTPNRVIEIEAHHLHEAQTRFMQKMGYWPADDALAGVFPTTQLDWKRPTT